MWSSTNGSGRSSSGGATAASSDGGSGSGGGGDYRGYMGLELDAVGQGEQSLDGLSERSLLRSSAPLSSSPSSSSFSGWQDKERHKAQKERRKNKMPTSLSSSSSSSYRRCHPLSASSSSTSSPSSSSAAVASSLLHSLLATEENEDQQGGGGGEPSASSLRRKQVLLRLLEPLYLAVEREWATLELEREALRRDKLAFAQEKEALIKLGVLAPDGSKRRRGGGGRGRQRRLGEGRRVGGNKRTNRTSHKVQLASSLQKANNKEGKQKGKDIVDSSGQGSEQQQEGSCLPQQQQQHHEEEEKGQGEREGQAEQRQGESDENYRYDDDDYDVNDDDDYEYSSADEDDDDEEEEDIIELNVGGVQYTTSRLTLTKEGSMLAAMFSGRYNYRRDRLGRIFIDRDGPTFQHIINYLRDGSVPCYSSSHKPEKLRRLLQEAQFFQLEGLMEALSGNTSPKCIWRFGECHSNIQLSADGLKAKNISALGSYTVARTTEPFDVNEDQRVYFEISNIKAPPGKTIGLGIVNENMDPSKTQTKGWTSSNAGVGLYLNSGNLFKCSKKLNTVYLPSLNNSELRFGMMVQNGYIRFLCEGRVLDTVKLPKFESRFYPMVILIGGCRCSITNNPPPSL
ncbi:BTB/POZ domain-containing protein kctd16 [Balamuthia mandrillaris]